MFNQSFELCKNPWLMSFDVKDLNVDPTFASFDKVTCVVSVDYLTKAKEVFDEIGRGLPSGWYVRKCWHFLTDGKEDCLFFLYVHGFLLLFQDALLISFCTWLHSFPTKAWDVWLRTSDLEYVFIAGSFCSLLWFIWTTKLWWYLTQCS